MVKLIDIQLVANLLKALSSVPISRNELNWLKMRVSGWTLVKTAPSSASIVLGLNTSAIYLGVSFSTFIGKHVYQTLGTDSLNVVAAGFIVLAFGIYSFSHHISLNDKANIT